jgi:hypothetical protein
MAITAIVQEIDTYLARLRKARNLLLTPAAKARRRRAPHSATTSDVTKRILSVPGRRRVPPKKSRPKGAVPKQHIADKRNDPVDKLRGPDARPAVDHGPPVVPSIAPPPRRAIEKETFSSPIRSARRKTARQAFAGKPKTAKAPTALSGATSSKIVVVSAAEAQRERQRTAHAEVKQPRVPSTGGRQAFEALFKDGTVASRKPLV